MRTTLTRAVASVAIAATAVLGAAGVASATTPPKTPTQLAISAAKGSITVGQKDVISGRLHAGATNIKGRIIILDRWNPTTKKWNSVEEKFTGSLGKVYFNVYPKVNTWYVLAFKGGPIYKASHSAEVRIVVKPFVKTPTSLSASAATASITKGSTDKVDGTLVITKDTKALPGQWVWLDTVVSGKLHHLRALKTGKFGKVQFTVKPAATTTYELEYLGTHVLAPSVSNAVTVTVAS
ncbi:MAG TPA: hypothetical protein VHZ33_07635 [Trebonia sp.]|jgi:hypothetical protein|nr:hypothetical protein [Trebonia sp.]